MGARVAAAVLLAVLPACAAHGQSDPPRPLSLEQTERLLRSGVALTQIASWARSYCIDFRFTRSAAIRLRDAGADRELLGVLGDACVKEPERAAPVQVPAQQPQVDARPDSRREEVDRRNDEAESSRTRHVYPDGLEVWRAAGMAAVAPGWPWLSVPERRNVGYAIAGGVGLGVLMTIQTGLAESSARHEYKRALVDGAPDAVVRLKRNEMNSANTRHNLFKVLTGAAWLGQIALAVRTWSPQEEPVMARIGSGRLSAGITPEPGGGLGLSFAYVAPLPLLGHTPR